MYEMNESSAKVEPKLKIDELDIKTRPIEGDVYQGHVDTRTPATAAEFMEATDAILSVPGVHGVRWRAFTPYFNDGEPCEYSVGEIAVRFTPLEDEEDERGDYEDGFIEKWNLSYSWKDGEIPELTDGTYEALTKALKDWESLYLEAVCKRNFGDHAQVTATLEGFSVDYYEHD